MAQFRSSSRGSLMAPVLLLLGVLPGCATVPSGPSPQLVASEAREAAQQIRRCYRQPRVASAGRQISTRLLVRFLPDGRVAGVPVVLAQSGITPSNQPYAVKMAEAAGLAVMRCTPVQLSPKLYQDGWSELEFTFSPAARG